MLVQRKMEHVGLGDGFLTNPILPKMKFFGFNTRYCSLLILGLSRGNDPQKRIAALELCGTLFLALMLMDKQPAASCRLDLPLISDNQGNVFSILNDATGTEDAYGGDLDGTGLSTISSGTHARSIPFVMTINGLMN